MLSACYLCYGKGFGKSKKIKRAISNVPDMFHVLWYN